MSRDITEIYGKRLKSPEPAIMYLGHPGSDTVETLPAGQPSPKIDSYLPSGYFQLIRGSGSDRQALYVKDQAPVKVVPADAADDSGIFGSAWAWVSDTFTNTGTKAAKQAGFLSEGFKDSVSGVSTGFFNFADAIKPVLILLIILAGILFINKLSD